MQQIKRNDGTMEKMMIRTLAATALFIVLVAMSSPALADMSPPPEITALKTLISGDTDNIREYYLHRINQRLSEIGHPALEDVKTIDEVRSLVRAARKTSTLIQSWETGEMWLRVENSQPTPPKVVTDIAGAAERLAEVAPILQSWSRHLEQGIVAPEKIDSRAELQKLLVAKPFWQTVHEIGMTLYNTASFLAGTDLDSKRGEFFRQSRKYLPVGEGDLADYDKTNGNRLRNFHMLRFVRDVTNQEIPLPKTGQPLLSGAKGEHTDVEIFIERFCLALNRTISITNLDPDFRELEQYFHEDVWTDNITALKNARRSLGAWSVDEIQNVITENNTHGMIAIQADVTLTANIMGGRLVTAIDIVLGKDTNRGLSIRETNLLARNQP